MKSHLLSDLEASDIVGDSDIIFNPFAPTGHGIAGVPHSSPESRPPLAATAVAPILPAESMQAMAAVSSSGSGGTGSVVAETSSSGFTINLNFDSRAMAAPASFRAGIEQAASILSATITNKITVNISIDYFGTGGGAAAGPDNGLFESYSTVRSDLIASAAPGDTSFNALPTGSKIQGQSQVAVWNAQLKLFGLLGANDTTTDDGSATFATDINTNLLVGVALHELTHALGRVPFGPSTTQPSITQPDIFDFYRFTSAGNILIDGNDTAQPAYFSLNGGVTKIADFGQTSDPSDFLNSGVQGFNDPFNEFYSSSTFQSLTVVDKQMLDALGFNTSPPGLAVVANPVEALQGGPAVSLLSSAPAINDPGSTTLSSATVKIANALGNAVAGDELFVNGIQNGSLGNGVTASWNATTDTLTLSGTASTAVYDTLLSEVTFQDTGTDTSGGSHPVRTVTFTINDGTNSFNATSQLTIDRAPAASNNAATDTVGAAIGATAANGVLSNASDLDGDKLTVAAVSDAAHGAGTVGTSLAGAYGHLTLNADGSYAYVADNGAAISAGATGGHLQDVFSYAVSDGNGGSANASLTVTLDRAPVVTASNITLSAGISVAGSSLFSATDPDGNTITAYALEDTGPGHFVLNGTVVEPNNQEIDVSAAQLSQLTYQSVAGSPDTLQIRVNDGTLWSNWASLTVTPNNVIESSGSTSLVEVGSNYFLDPVAGGTGPELMYNGSPVTVGQFDPYVPVAVEQTASGYEVALKNASTNQFSIWNTDSNGNFQNFAVYAGNSSALESLETSFHQDLNGDGTTGVTVTTIESAGSTSLLQVGNNYFFNSVGGPELKFGGSTVTVGQFDPYVPVAVEQTASGYEVALKNAGTNQFSIWNTDSNGNFQSFAVYAGNSTALELLETSFHQDLNGDSVTGPPTTVIESSGSTSLLQVGNNYFFNSVNGPELKFNGSPVTVGQFDPYVPVAVEQTATGYEVALKNAGTGQFSIWNTDSNGNFQSFAVYAGNSTALESLETSFQQDLNGDSTTGVKVTTIESSGSTSLLQVGNNYFFNSVSGPELKYNGSPVTVGQFDPYVPVAVEQTASGYEVALKNAGTGQFSIWNTDSNGNFQSFAVYAGNSTALESLETSFHQDLNADGVIGIPAAQASGALATGATPHAASGGNDTFVFRPGIGADVIENAASTDVFELDGFSAVTNSAQLADLLSEAQIGHSQGLFQSSNSGHDTVINLGNHDSITLVDVHIADLHANSFIIR